MAAVGSYAFSTRHVCSSDTHTTNKEGLGGVELGETGGRYIALQCTGAIVGYMRILIKVKQKKRQRPKMKNKKIKFWQSQKVRVRNSVPFFLDPFFFTTGL